jgi:hypothetical protein
VFVIYSYGFSKHHVFTIPPFKVVRHNVKSHHKKFQLISSILKVAPSDVKFWNHVAR